MRFFRNRKEQSSTDLKKNNGFDLNDCLDYFSKLDKVCNKIIEQERQVLNGIDSDLTSHEVDAVLNKSLILERAFEKYDSVEDFNLINAEWFPRLRTYKTRDKETESISSNDSVGEIRVQIIILLFFWVFFFCFLFFFSVLSFEFFEFCCIRSTHPEVFFNEIWNIQSEGFLLS